MQADKGVFKAFCNKDVLREMLSQVLGDVPFEIKSKYWDNLVTINYCGFDKTRIREFEQKIYSDLGKYIYFDDDISLVEFAILLLKTYGKRVGVAESLTGGLVSDAFVSVSGASEVFSEGLTCYSNDAKIANLGVSPKTLMLHTAVSKEVASEMVRGILAHSYSDYAISTTGYAENYNGKNNGGIVFIGVGDANRIDAFGYRFTGNRQEIRNIAKNAAIFHLIKKIKGSFDYM